MRLSLLWVLRGQTSALSFETPIALSPQWLRNPSLRRSNKLFCLNPVLLKTYGYLAIVGDFSLLCFLAMSLYYFSNFQLTNHGHQKLGMWSRTRGPGGHVVWGRGSSKSLSDMGEAPAEQEPSLNCVCVCCGQGRPHIQGLHHLSCVSPLRTNACFQFFHGLFDSAQLGS